MKRRAFLTGVSGAALGAAGCLGLQRDDSTPAADAPFETLSVGGVSVPLVPVDVAHEWYQTDSPQFVDARGEGQYRSAHVTDAVLSPARPVEKWSKPRDGPTTDWPTDARIVCYCGCPHHLSSLRAGEFIDEGYTDVYAIDEGFFAWQERGYPVTGESVSQNAVHVTGRTDPGDAGGYAWASHEPSDQREAAPIDSDGRYRIELRFADVGPRSPIHLRTPSYELTAPLSELTSGVVEGP